MAEQTNADRIERVFKALQLYDDPNDLRSNIVDCMADMMHAWEQEGADELFEGLIYSARVHFVAELEEENFVEGNVVFWTDPDEGACSGYFRVILVNDATHVLKLGQMDTTDDTIVCEAPYEECTIIANS